MVSDTIYELCQPVLQDKELPDEEKTEKLEELLQKEASLTGKALEDAVLNVLWQHRNSSGPHAASSPPLRHTVIRRASPAPWQIPRVSSPLVSSPGTGTSPATSHAFPSQRPSFVRKGSAASPFTSPRPSPRLALAQPIPHSPNLSTYEPFGDASPVPDIYGDYGSDTVDWLVNDDAASTTSSTGGSLSAAAPEWIPQPDMTPFDLLRSVLGEGKTDEEIEKALEINGYDLGATMIALTEGQVFDSQNLVVPDHDGSVLVGKSMDYVRPVTPSGQVRSPIPCKYWLAHGQCLRADCRFSHELKNHVCKYWLGGNCLAGDACPFSHDPSALVGNLSIQDGGAMMGTPPQEFVQPMMHMQDQTAFPALQPGLADTWQTAAAYNRNQQGPLKSFYPHSQNPNNRNSNGYSSSRPHSRPTSRHQHREQVPSAPSVDDPEAFPTLASLNAKGAKKHHGKRGGHGHNNHHKENIPGSLADVVRMTPSPSPGNRKVPKNTKSAASRENTAAAQSIPSPRNIPWLETGARANSQYLKYRQEAIKHGSMRNKFLQSAAQAWNRNDARAAKALSLRGQTENEAMRKAHREAARCLYEDRNKHVASPDFDPSAELYIDLHGLHPEEAVEYLDRILSEQRQQSSSHLHPKSGDGRIIIYAITGTGHHSKNGKDKVGKAVRGWLNEWRYIFREFSVPGDRGGNVGGVLGIDAASWDKNAGGGESVSGEEGASGTGEDQKGLQVGKVRLLKREDVETS